jgi:hypothetical protein
MLPNDTTLERVVQLRSLYKRNHMTNRRTIYLENLG